MNVAIQKKKPPERGRRLRGWNRKMSGFDRITVLAVLAPGGDDFQAHLLADSAGQEPAHRMRLPAGGFHQLFGGDPAGPLQQFEDRGCLAAVASGIALFFGLARLGAFLAEVAFFPGLPFLGATFAPFLVTRVVLVALGSAVVLAGAVSICSVLAIMLSPLAVIIAVTTSIPLVAAKRKAIL